MQASQARAHSASIILGLQNRPHWQQSLGHLYLNNLQTCRGHVDGTGALRSTIGEWLRLLAVECYSWLYKEGEGEHQHVLCIVLNDALLPAVNINYKFFTRMRVRHVMPPYILQSFQQLSKKGGTEYECLLTEITPLFLASNHEP